jgi:hypothetical protein
MKLASRVPVLSGTLIERHRSSFAAQWIPRQPSLGDEKLQAVASGDAKGWGGILFAEWMIKV